MLLLLLMLTVSPRDVVQIDTTFHYGCCMSIGCVVKDETVPITTCPGTDPMDTSTIDSCDAMLCAY